MLSISLKASSRVGMATLILAPLFWGFSLAQPMPLYQTNDEKISLTPAGASHLAQLPLKCMQQEYPYKTAVIYTGDDMIAAPKEYHPAFYGCFDWHSSVHGHWMLVRLLKLFSDLPERDSILTKLSQNLSAENIQQEIALFTGLNKSFERTYGWAWLLQLQTELLSWEGENATALAQNLQPLADSIAGFFQEYLPKMNYPVRSGEHSNLAFGLRLAFDYAEAANDSSLKDIIIATATRFYLPDENCPISWEPGGADFLSPCLEEADLMWRILPTAEYQSWLGKFLPALADPAFALAPGTVSDRTDGKLVHLDGLNLSRAWCLYGIAHHAGENQRQLLIQAKRHLLAALPNVASGDYMGEHWLASFAVYALTTQE